MGAPEGHSRPQEAPERSLRLEAPGAPRSHRRSLEAPASTGQLRVPRRLLIGFSMRLDWSPASRFKTHQRQTCPHSVT